MGSEMENRYDDLRSYVREMHQKNKKRVKASAIVLFLLPVILMAVRWLTDSDKIVFLIIWILCMFALSVYLVSVEYMDHVLQKRLGELTGIEMEESLLDASELVPARVRDKVKGRKDSAQPEETEEGGDE